MMVLDKPMVMTSFNGSKTRCPAMAFVHLIIKQAVYPQPLHISPNLPGTCDVVLGLPFQAEFCRPVPAAMRFCRASVGRQQDLPGLALVHSSPLNPKANSAVERLVLTMKNILHAKVANAVYNWPALPPQVQGDYMARVHRVTGFSPNDLVYATKVRRAAPIGDLHWNGEGVRWVASCQQYVEERNARFESYCESVYDRILTSQRASVERARQAAASKARGGESRCKSATSPTCLRVEATASVSGPFVVHGAEEGSQVTLRSTARVRDQELKYFKRARALVARCWTVADSLEKLLKEMGFELPVRGNTAEQLAAWHTG
jgi:hypothetical protein